MGLAIFRNVFRPIVVCTYNVYNLVTEQVSSQWDQRSNSLLNLSEILGTIFRFHISVRETLLFLDFRHSSSDWYAKLIPPLIEFLYPRLFFAFFLGQTFFADNKV